MNSLTIKLIQPFMRLLIASSEDRRLSLRRLMTDNSRETIGIAFHSLDWSQVLQH